MPHKHKASKKATLALIGPNASGIGTLLNCGTFGGEPGHGSHIITDVCACGAKRIAGGSPVCRPRWTSEVY